MSVPDDGELGRLLAEYDRAFGLYRDYYTASFAVGQRLNRLKNPSEDEVESFLRALDQLREVVTDARKVVNALADHLDEASGELVTFSPIVAPNLHEALVLLWQSFGEHTWSHEDFGGDPNEVRSGRWRKMTVGPIPDQSWAELRRERANLRKLIRELRKHSRESEAGLWRWEGGRVVLDGSMKQLVRQNRRLMTYMIQRQGRLLTYGELGADVWERPDNYRPETIQQAVSKLRADLKKLELDAVAKRIRTESGGYLFE